jgi:insulysin
MIGNNFQYFDIETTINESRDIRGIELKNGIKVVLISDPKINMSSCSVAVGAGYWQDEYEGTAHFLEHLLFMGSEKYKEQNEYHSYVQICGGSDNAFTTDNITCYYLTLETTFLKKGIEILSWFFRAPLLDVKHINSELDIIDSEHKKNILQDMWIMDDIFKNFINKSKFTKFGTGNKTSLKGIKKEDIMNYYNRYYTTDNLFVCIVDSKPINVMQSDYLDFFIEIPEKKYSGKENRFEKEDLNLINNNLILYNLHSDYKYFNYILLIDCDERNQEDYQILYLINYLIGLEYEDSLCYYLKENDYIKHMNCNLEYFYDKQAEININCVLNDDKDINDIYSAIESYIKNLSEISEKEFKDIYTNYQKIKLIKSLYSNNNDSMDISNEIVENMIKGDNKYCVIRKNYVPDYNNKTYTNFINKIKNLNKKITTNMINETNNYKFTKSKWYDSTFYITDIDKKIDDKVDYNYKIIKSIGINDFIIRLEQNLKKNKKIKIPKLIYENNKLSRKIYLLNENKFGKPINNISIIRRNIKVLDKYNKVVVNLYILLCKKIINYYLETMSSYKMNFTMILTDEYLVQNYYGLNYILNNYLSQIIVKIHPDNIFVIFNVEKYYNEIIRDLKHNILNSKYNSPYQICSEYLNIILNNLLMPDEKIEFLSKLSFDKFKKMLLECLTYTEEFYIFVGKFDNDMDFDNKKVYKSDSNINYIVEQLSLNPRRYLDIELDKKYKLIKEVNLESFIISKKNYNSKEINNCLIRNFVIYEKKFEIIDGKMDIVIIKEYIKNRLICGFIADMLNEPLFDRIRTIDKLGYIVKCDKKIVFDNDNILMGIIYLVQSAYSIKRIISSINIFNKFITNDIKVNNDVYVEKFKLLKKSKLLELKKPFSDLVDEISSYVDTIVSKIFDFNINKLTYEICKKIDFSKDIIKAILLITNGKLLTFDIVLNKDN